MGKNYNEIYIETFDSKKYEDVLYNTDLLKGVYEDYANRYSNSKIDIDIISILFKESLDHYVLKKLTDDINYLDSLEMHNYMDFIERICEFDNAELNTNVIFKDKDLRNKILDKYASNVKKNLEKQIISNSNMCDVIIKKIEDGKDIFQSELDFVCSYISRLRIPNLDSYDILLKFIFGKMKDTNLKFSYQTQDLVLSYIPYFYGNGLENVRYVIGSSRHGKLFKGPGLSYSNMSVIAVNRNVFSNVDIKSINDSFVERLKVGKDITFFMIFAFHEITHQKQRNSVKLLIYDDSTMAYIMHSIINHELNDCHTNHDSSESEIAANYYGWEKSKEFYEKFYTGEKRETLLSNCENNKKTSNIRRSFAYKIDDNGEYFPHYQYDILNLTKIIENNPQYLEKYPMLRIFFNSKGIIKYHFMFEKGITSPVGFEFCFAFFKLGGIENLIDNIDNIELDDLKINNLLDNCLSYINLTYEKISDLSFPLDKANVGEYDNCDINEEIVKILSRKYLKFALSAYDKFIILLNKIVLLYPNKLSYVNNIISLLNKKLGVNYSISKEINITKK